MEWLFTDPNKPLQEYDEIAWVLAPLLGSTESSAKEGMATRQKDIDQEEDLVQVPSIDEIFSTCIKLLINAKESLDFSFEGLVTMIMHSKRLSSKRQSYIISCRTTEILLLGSWKG